MLLHHHNKSKCADHVHRHTLAYHAAQPPHPLHNRQLRQQGRALPTFHAVAVPLLPHTPPCRAAPLVRSQHAAGLHQRAHAGAGAWGLQVGASRCTARAAVQTSGSCRPAPQKVAPMAKSTSPRLSVLRSRQGSVRSAHGGCAPTGSWEVQGHALPGCAYCLVHAGGASLTLPSPGQPLLSAPRGWLATVLFLPP